MTDTPINTFTHGPLGTINLKTALPIMVGAVVKGLLSKADALFPDIWRTDSGAAAILYGAATLPLWRLAQDRPRKRCNFHAIERAAS